MKCYVVVEGPTDAGLITRLLPVEIQQQAAVVLAGGRANLASVARTLLVTRRKPLAVLVDADTVDQSTAIQARRDIEGLVRAASGGIPFKVIMLVPEMEGLLFRAPEALERITGQPLSADTLALARYNPLQAIMQLGPGKSAILEQVVKGLTDEDVDAIRDAAPIKELIEFLTETVAPKHQPQTA